MGGLYLPQIPVLISAPPCPQATVLCDLLLLHILPKRHYYKQKKFKYAEDMGPGEGEHDPVATSSTLGLQENMRTS